MDFLQILQVISTVVIALFAVLMWQNARAMKRLEEANLNNAKAMKELEETNIKIAMWPEIKDLWDSTHEFLKMSSRQTRKGKSKIIEDYYGKILHLRFFLNENDELLISINDLISKRQELDIYEQKKGKINLDGGELSKEWMKKQMELIDIYKEVANLFENKFRFALETNKSQP